MIEDRPYAGILMNDGTEISHYGVKGMKWGKKLFGKVKGVFGKPEKINYEGSKHDPNSVSRKGKGKNLSPISDSKYKIGKIKPMYIPGVGTVKVTRRKYNNPNSSNLSKKKK